MSTPAPISTSVPTRKKVTTLTYRQKKERGEVTEEWYLDRRRLLNQYPDDSTDQRLHLTSDFTLLAPLRYFLYRALRQRAESLGLRLDVDEGAALEWDRRAETRR